jgi:plastocyanin
VIERAAGILPLLLAGIGCTGSSGGYAGGAIGSVLDATVERRDTGTTDGGFSAVAPCPAASSYLEGATTVAFGGTTGYVYAPSCLKLAVGGSVAFLGDFASHPLSPSATRGTLAGNPITNVSAGAARTFTFPAPGFYAYFCPFHGTLDDGTGMAGVIWVE